jgi:hypothetical protein
MPHTKITQIREGFAIVSESKERKFPGNCFQSIIIEPTMQPINKDSKDLLLKMPKRTTIIGGTRLNIPNSIINFLC